jgi:hypothetical protein
MVMMRPLRGVHAFMSAFSVLHLKPSQHLYTSTVRMASIPAISNCDSAHGLTGKESAEMAQTWSVEGEQAMAGVLGLVVFLAIAIALFLIFRAVVLWYFRIDEGIALLKSIDEKLGRLEQRGGPPP